MSRLLVAIDEGTTGIKVGLYNERLEAVRMVSRAKVTRYPRPGWVEQDAEVVLEAVVELVGEVLAGLEGEVVGCGIDHQGESVLAWDATTGEPLSPIIVWQDRRAPAVLAALKDRAGEIERRSGLPLDPYFSATKLAWLLECNPAVQLALGEGRLRLGTVDAFLTDRLGGLFATDAATASRTQLQALGGDGFDPGLADLFRIPLDVLPVVCDSVGDLGVLRHESWPMDLPLWSRVPDQQAALAGAGCVVPGRVKATYGTGVFVLAHAGSDQPPVSSGLVPTVAWRIGGHTEYALDGGVFAAGAMLEWLSESLGIADSAAGVASLAETVEDSGGVRLLPALAGLGAPWWKPEARAVIAGLRGASTGAHIARAALEGIAWRVVDVLEAMAEIQPLAELRVDGGLSQSNLLLSLQADAAGMTIERRSVEATARGCAALAAVGAGLFDSPQETSELLEPGTRVEPRHSPTARTQAHAEWRTFVESCLMLTSEPLKKETSR
jgi:glycerol kinase